MYIYLLTVSYSVKNMLITLIQSHSWQCIHFAPFYSARLLQEQKTVLTDLTGPGLWWGKDNTIKSCTRYFSLGKASLCWWVKWKVEWIISWNGPWCSTTTKGTNRNVTEVEDVGLDLKNDQRDGLAKTGFTISLTSWIKNQKN